MSAYPQAALVTELCAIFPEFAEYWNEENELEEFRSTSIHSVYMSLLPFLSQISPTPKQWKHFADHLNEAVASGGDQENAAYTCVLEHLHQVELSKVLRPLLSEEARAYVRA